MSLEIKVPSPGESISEVTISKLLVNVGDYIELDQPIIEVESEKATLEINAEKAGLLEKFTAAEGDTVKVGDVVAMIDTNAKAPTVTAKKEVKVEAPKIETAKAATVATPTKTESKSVSSTKKDASTFEQTYSASPLAEQLLKEYGLNPAKVKGSGLNGRITKMDVLQAAVEQGGAHGVSSGYAKGTGSRDEKREKMSNLRKTIAKRLVMAKNETAMLTTFNEVNMKPIMDLRAKYKDSFKEKHNVSLGFMSFFTRACVLALQKWPAVNAFIDGDEIVFNDFCDISIAVSGPRGLVVPVIRNAETLSLAEIESEVKRLAIKARDNKLSIEEMTGGTFTITNGGVFGSMMSTPIINPPQSAILGMHNIVERPWVENGKIEIRPVMYIALSYDHRVIDGRESVSFLFMVKTLLENPEMLLNGNSPYADLLNL
ncbi:MAG: 2-oxoglutarate dehydrogenase complex dihydrolipoyllysine-residue succinyltransferase [Bacteroidetes bacterium]|nr:2-oxoglutarate dehydrogenase complex dihydrolipoyllysine-residue succinyltransferase [Bacteroidota bacterium]